MQKPTPQRVVDVIQVENELSLQPDYHLCLYFLKEYVLWLDQEDLTTFLHFVTGASFSPEEINVAFNAVSGFMRHLTAHTSGNCLSCLQLIVLCKNSSLNSGKFWEVRMP